MLRRSNKIQKAYFPVKYGGLKAKNRNKNYAKLKKKKQTSRNLFFFIAGKLRD